MKKNKPLLIEVLDRAKLEIQFGRYDVRSNMFFLVRDLEEPNGPMYDALLIAPVKHRRIKFLIYGAAYRHPADGDRNQGLYYFIADDTEVMASSCSFEKLLAGIAQDDLYSVAYVHKQG